MIQGSHKTSVQRSSSGNAVIPGPSTIPFLVSGFLNVDNGRSYSMDNTEGPCAFLPPGPDSGSCRVGPRSKLPAESIAPP